MPRTTIPLNVLSSGGFPFMFTGETDGDSVNGHDIDNEGNVFFVVRNANAGAAHNLTIKGPRTIDGVQIADVLISIGASATRMFGPFRVILYNQDNGRVNFDADSTNLKIKGFRLPEVS